MLTKFRALLGQFQSDKSGVTAIEYGVIAAAIIVLIVLIVFNVGTDVQQAFKDLQAALP